MCRSKMAVEASEPVANPNPTTTRPSDSSTRVQRNPSKSEKEKPSSNSPRNVPKSPNLLFDPSTSGSASGSRSSYRIDTSVATTSVSGRTSLSSLRDTLPESTQIYDFSEIRTATNNFLAKRYSSTSSSSQSWRSVLNGKDVIIFQRKLRKSMDFSSVKEKLLVISKSHYMSIVKLLGVSISGEHIYLVYDFVSGSDLSLCLRNPRNPHFTVLSTWMSRMQIATDVAHGLDYIHNTAGLSIDMVHKHVKSSGIIVTEPSYNAKICHFGAAELCGETREEDRSRLPELKSERQFEGVRGYMSPEFKATGIATQKSDVYAFGVVILELLTGQEPETYKFDKDSKNYKRLSIIETAKETVEDGGGEGVEMRLRKWVDKRLKDSFPVEVAENLTRVALQCVHLDPDDRPDMKWVAGKISKFYLASKKWSEKFKIPTEISVSLGPR
ncbi:lysM domain receptor-like kinase 3 [Olea europaea subsp. europaea]|uniref:LysM domain receptor-like kinase 3 n=1 Tax=Olea europaea subsp. europaea TaxID=158383 RepID=A0A8S0VNB3_OLEEU|nr:lysM domain receptor-like kinase 3 [Olea europaea subsp. europaea]